MSLCEAEKTYILHGAAQNLRIDGRKCDDYRPIELETDLVAHGAGSARLRLANTDVLVAVKAEIDVPFPDFPLEGKLEFFVDCSANATPDFEGRGGETLAESISKALSSAYKSNKIFDLTQLCIVKGRKCWKLYVDVLILECGGNLFDAVSLAAKAALWTTQIPRVKSVNLDGNHMEINVSDSLDDCIHLNVSLTPVMVTVCKIGDKCLVDPNLAEEQCSMSSIVVSVTEDKAACVLQNLSGGFNPSTMQDAFQMGLQVAKRLNQALCNKLKELQQNNSNNKAGFLN